MINKLDEGLEGINEFFKSITSRINPNKILMVTLVNGFLLGLMTTGFLGDETVSVWSLDFVFFIWQFLIICVFSSSHVNFNTVYLQKFIFVGVLGYAIQQQSFTMVAIEYKMEVAKNMSLIVDNGFANFLFFILLVYGLKFCFSGNQSRKEPLEKYTLYKQDKISNKVS